MNYNQKNGFKQKLYKNYKIKNHKNKIKSNF